MDLTYKVGIDESELVQKLSQTKLMIDQTLQTAGSGYAGAVGASFAAPYEETMQSLFNQGQMQSTTRLSMAGRFTLGAAQVGAMAGEYTSLPFYQNLFLGTRPSGLAGEQIAGAMFAQLHQNSESFMSREALSSSMRATSAPFAGMLNFQQPLAEMRNAMASTGFMNSMRTPFELGVGLLESGASVRTAQAFGISGAQAGAAFSALAATGTAPGDLGRAFTALVQAGNAGVSDSSSLGAAAVAAGQRAGFQAIGSPMTGISGSQAIDAGRQAQYGIGGVAGIMEGQGKHFEVTNAQSQQLQAMVQQFAAMNIGNSSSDRVIKAMGIMFPGQMAHVDPQDLARRVVMANTNADFEMEKSKRLVEDTAQIQNIISPAGLARLAFGTVEGGLNKLGFGGLANFIGGVITPVSEPGSGHSMVHLTDDRMAQNIKLLYGDPERQKQFKAQAANWTGTQTAKDLFNALVHGDSTGAAKALAGTSQEVRDAVEQTIKDSQTIAAGPQDKGVIRQTFEGLAKVIGLGGIVNNIDSATMGMAAAIKKNMPDFQRAMGLDPDTHMNAAKVLHNRLNAFKDVSADMAAMGIKGFKEGDEDALMHAIYATGKVNGGEYLTSKEKPYFDAMRANPKLYKQLVQDAVKHESLRSAELFSGKGDEIIARIKMDVQRDHSLKHRDEDMKNIREAEQTSKATGDGDGALFSLLSRNKELAGLATSRIAGYANSGFSSANAPSVEVVIPTLIKSLGDLATLLKTFGQAR